MEVKIIKSDKGRTVFLYKGISIDGDGLMVDLYEENYRQVLKDAGENIDLYYYSHEWNRLQFPVYAKDKNGDIVVINDYNGDDDEPVLYLTYIYSDGRIIQQYESFEYVSEIYKWLNSLEILPKGTEIKITI